MKDCRWQDATGQVCTGQPSEQRAEQLSLKSPQKLPIDQIDTERHIQPASKRARYMNQKFSAVRSAFNSVMNGAGMLLIANPFPAQPDFAVTDGCIGHHFSQVGCYLRAAIATESPQLVEELKLREEPQLELPLSL